MSFAKRQQVINRVVELPIDDIVMNPDQPRKVFNERALRELATSIKSNGLLQPITVRINRCGSPELISGERRLRACALNGVDTIPAIIIDVPDDSAAVLALIENLQRADLNYFEEAQAIERLINRHGLTQEECAVRLGKAQSTLSNKLRLLKLPKDLRELIISHGLTERHARALLKLEDEVQQMEAAKIIIDKGLNVGQTEKLIDSYFQEPQQKQRNVYLIKDIRIFLNTVKKAVDIMRKSGLEVDTVKTVYDDFIEVSVKVPIHN